MKNMNFLTWPTELVGSNSATATWGHAGHNLVLDFHGDPAAAALTVLSDGNHHMALHRVLQTFVEHNPDVSGVFYVTLPPGLLLDIIQNKGMAVGNLFVPVNADLLLGPSVFFTNACLSQKTTGPVPFIQNRGCVLLVRKGNPHGIKGVADLLRDEIRLFISSPEREKVSHESYRSTLIDLAVAQGVDRERMEKCVSSMNNNIVYGQSVHHREAPQALYSNNADVAIVYYHLALRYITIFPEDFEMIVLTGSARDPQTCKANPATKIFMARMMNDNPWGKKLYDFLRTPEVVGIYTRYGLQPCPMI